jgi:hypothetical protein
MEIRACEHSFASDPKVESFVAMAMNVPDFAFSLFGPDLYLVRVAHILYASHYTLYKLHLILFKQNI